MPVFPASAVIPTRNRAGSLRVTLESLLRQNLIPAELIIVDGSESEETHLLIKEFASKLNPACRIKYLRADRLGAAVQRNQGVAAATQNWIWFLDDDILFESECVLRLWNAAQSDPKIGGVNALIQNQRYQNPGRASRLIFSIMAGASAPSYAGRVLGPAVNLLPEDESSLPEVNPVEWLNTTCTIYRREALPSPPFDSMFTGYSLMEDLTLSLRVGRKWKLANARSAKIFHDSQPGPHKQSIRAMAEMELVNRHYVMTQVLGRKSSVDHFKLFMWELFQLASLMQTAKGRGQLGENLQGKRDAINKIRSTIKGSAA